MLKIAAAVLAVPIVAAVYVTSALRRSTLVRGGLAVGLGAVLAVSVVLVGRPATVTATPPSAVVPLTSAAFGPVVETDAALDEPMTIAFTAPMDAESVAALLSVEPATSVALDWDPAGTTLTIAPSVGWAASTFHTVSVAAGALARSGQPLLGPVRAGFLTRGPSAVAIAATDPLDWRVGVGTAFGVTFDRPVSMSSAAAGIRIAPEVAGTLSPAAGSTDGTQYVFTPSEPLQPDTRYRLTVDGVHDTEGGPIVAASLLVRTADAPAVVRFRPRDDTLDVARDATLSVRFTAAMDRASTAKAFAVTAGTKAVKGTVTFAEGDQVLVFEPAAPLPYKTKITMVVRASATAADGTPIAAAARGIFRTVPAPAVQVANTGGGGDDGGGSGGGSGGSGGGTGGGAVGGGSWGSVETYYLGLMNCTRTGGWVTSSGSCSSPGGRNVAPLKLDAGISSKVARPYAKKLAVGNDCSHFIGGNPGDRLKAAGYSSYRWAENLGCRSGGAKSAVLGSHLFFQSEKSYNGGHYVNMMNAAYDRVGIGVWVSGGRVRLVVDFYHP